MNNANDDIYILKLVESGHGLQYPWAFLSKVYDHPQLLSTHCQLVGAHPDVCLIVSSLLCCGFTINCLLMLPEIKGSTQIEVDQSFKTPIVLNTQLEAILYSQPFQILKNLSRFFLQLSVFFKNNLIIPLF